MEEWNDQALVLSAKSHGESGAIVTLLTEQHGRYVGYLRGGQSSRLRGVLEPGNLVRAQWSARTADNMGAYRIEQERYLAAGLIHDPLKLSALLSACSLCEAALPEREAHPGLYYGMLALIEAMEGDAWAAAYIVWELALMRELGFGIDLSRCAGGGDAADLIYVSPRSGQAVSREAGAPYKDKLLPLPAFLQPGKGAASDEEVVKGLELTRYFFDHWVFAHSHKGIPENRVTFQERFGRVKAA